MVDLETAARWFKDAFDAPGAVESATQLRTLLASIKADLQRLLRRIHPPGPPTVPRAPRVVVAHAVLSSAMPTCEPSKRLDSYLQQVILLVCHGVHRGDGDRIVVEVVTRDVTSGTFLVSGLSRVHCGFSFPVSNAPRQYDVAMEAAVAAHCGVLEIGPSLAG
ncbi:hypothetical protein EMCRGX_G022603 [Ephydatia muelleri]